MSTRLDVQDLLRGRHSHRPAWPNPKQRSLDFYGSEPAVQVHTEDEESRLIEKVDKALADVPENFDDLDDPAVYAHRICLIWHVNTFAYARNQKQRDEALEWFLDPPQLGWLEKDLKKADLTLVPFTFELCCLLEGIDVRLARASILKLNEKLQGKPLRRRPYVNSDPACKAASDSTSDGQAASSST